MSVTLNCFPVAITPTRLPLFFGEYADWEVASQVLKREYGGSAVHRFWSDQRVIMAFLKNAPSGLKEDVFLIEALPHLGMRLIERSLTDHFRAAGFRVRHEQFGVSVLRSTPEFSHGRVDIRTGIEFQARRPFEERPLEFVLTAQWVADARFNATLQDAALRGFCKGMPVKYEPQTVSDALRIFRWKYVGVVAEAGATTCTVECRDGQCRDIPAEDLVLEASPFVLKQYERLNGGRLGANSLTQRLQLASLVTTAEGKRNRSVLKDRLHAIQTVLGANASNPQLTVSLACDVPGTVTVALKPVVAEDAA